MITRSDRLKDIRGPNAHVERIATGFAFVEGPIWNQAGSFLLFSDIPGDVRRRWTAGNHVEEVLRPTNRANGMTYDADGSLIVCEHSTSSVVRESADGSGSGREVLASHFEGRQLNSPNDVVAAQDGSIYFTDPSYGRTAEFGVEREQELGFQGVFRIASEDGELQLVADDFAQPNGLCFAPGERVLYVNDTERAHIKAFDVHHDGTLLNERIFFEGLKSEQIDGVPDGMKCDIRGHVFVTGPGGLWVIAPNGAHLGTIGVPEVVANLNWGGPSWSDLYLTATSSLYRLTLQTQGNRVSSTGVCG